MTASAGLRTAVPGDRTVLDGLHRRASYVWEEDRAQLDAHPDALGVDPASIVAGRVRVALGPRSEIVGFATVVSDGGDRCALEDLFVDPAVMRRGVGWLLVEDAVERARTEGYREMTVIAHPRVFPFYERLGFVPAEVVQTRFGPARRLRRRLTR